MTLQRVRTGSTSSPSVACPSCNGSTPVGAVCARCGALLAISNRRPRGAELGSYRIEDLLGQGGMGLVYLATHTRLGRRVAIKVLRPEYASNPQAIRRFFAEARAVNKIVHPNIIEVTDSVEKPGEDNYYVMELLEGASVAVLIDAGGVPDLGRSVAIMTQLADALAAVHRAGIVHCDIKPDNIVLVEKGGKPDFVKLCDFGIARAFDTTLARPSAANRPIPETPGMETTQDSEVHGTPQYMSPEQAQGHELDPRSDIYSFGVMLYELATGRLPLSAASVSEMVSKLQDEAPTPPSQLAKLPHPVPPALESLIMECLAKAPSERPKDIERVGERLERIAEDQGWLVYELNVRAPSSVESVVESPPPVPARAATGEPPPLPTASAPTWLTRRTVIGIVAALAIAGLVVAVALRPGAAPAQSPRTTAPSTSERVTTELGLADARIAAGRLVGPNGDEALDHLVAARAIDPNHAGVRERLALLARKFEKLADEAIAAGSLAEAATHLQAVLIAEPDNAQAARKMAEIEEKILARQRGK